MRDEEVAERDGGMGMGMAQGKGHVKRVNEAVEEARGESNGRFRW